MKLSLVALMLLIVGVATAQTPVKIKTIGMTVPGSDAVVTVTKLPFSIVATPDPTGAYFIFQCPAGFEVTRKVNSTLIVSKAPNGTHTINLHTLPYNPGPNKLQGEGKIVVVVNVDAGTPPPSVPAIPKPVSDPVLSLPPVEEPSTPKTPTALLYEAELYIARHSKR